MDEVLVVGYFGFGNAGDDAIGIGTVEWIQERCEPVDIAVVSGDAPLFDDGEVTNVRFSPLAIAHSVIQRGDVVVTGGSHFHDRYRTRRGALKVFTFYLTLVVFSKVLRKEVHLLGHGVGPLDGTLSASATGVVFWLADTATVRDPQSVRELPGPVPDPVVAFDTSVLLDRPETDSTDESVLGVSVTPAFAKLEGRPHRDNELVSAIATAIDDPAVRDHIDRVVVYAFHTGAYNDDLSMSHALADAIKGLPTAVKPYDDDPVEFVEATGAADYFLGMKYHSLVFAFFHATPTVAVSYHPKCRWFHEYVGVEQVSVLEKETMVDDGCDDRLRSMVEDPSKFTAEMSIEEAEQKARRVSVVTGS
jgi:polysaccharide pyruvyl transferase WcaK-like protein